MTKRTEDELVKLVRDKIRQRFTNPELVLQTFKANIRSMMKTLHAPQVLTESEESTFACGIAQAVFEDLGRISGEAIRYRMSWEVLDKSRQRGFRLEEHIAYCDTFAKELVRTLLQRKFKQVVKQRNTARKQKQGKNDMEAWNAVT